MYKNKPFHECAMPGDAALSAIVLLSTLKHVPEFSNTKELSELVCKEMEKYNVRSEIVRVVDLNVAAGLESDMGEGDEWPMVEKKIRGADIVIMATPIWWGAQSSVMQRVVERMDALDEEYRQTGNSPLYNKVGGIIVTGSEDGAQHIVGNLCNFLQWSGLTLPPECAAYWVGEVGQDPSKDGERRRRNEATGRMARRMARNLTYYARLLKQHPMVTEKRQS